MSVSHSSNISSVEIGIFESHLNEVAIYSFFQLQRGMMLSVQSHKVK